MIVIIGSLRFSPQNMEKLRPHLQTLVNETRAKDGCHSYDVAEDMFEPGLVRFSETWPDQETLARHLQAPHMTPWRNIVMELGVLGRAFKVYDADEGRDL